MFAYRAVLFDFFGTLTRAVRRGPYHDRVAGVLRCDPGEMVAVLDGSFRQRSCGRVGDALGTLRWVCGELGAAPSRAALRAALAARVVALGADTTLRSDAVVTLRALRARGVRTAVVSDCGYELPMLLPSLPVAPLLDARVYSVDVGHCKPHPAMYHLACRQLGVAPAECLFVGDGGSRELTGATQVGMTAVRLTAPDLGRHLVYDAEPAWSGPAVRSLRQIVALVDGARALG